jgi:hypothetical protein
MLGDNPEGRRDPGRYLSCRWHGVLLQDLTRPQNRQLFIIYEWFETRQGSLRVAHGIGIEGIDGSGELDLGGARITAPMPCPRQAPATGPGCYAPTAPPMAVDVASLPVLGTRVFAWNEEMVLGADMNKRPAFRDSLTFTITGPGANPMPRVVMTVDDEFRCDRVIENTSGCVNPDFIPTITFDASAYPNVLEAAKHMRRAQDAGQPGRPGSNRPLFRTTDPNRENDNRRDSGCVAARARWRPLTCDEYPFATTLQGGSGASIAPVPSAANSSQGWILRNGYKDSRIMNADDYYVSVPVRWPARTGSVAPYAALATQFNSYSDNATCADWSGGDATNSIALPDGQRAWFFSDSYLGSPADRRTFFFTSSVNNSVVVQNGSSMRTVTGGNTCRERDDSVPFLERYAKSIARAPDQGGFYWTGDQQLVGSDVVKFYYHGYHTEQGLWVNDYSAVASIPAAALQSPSQPALTVEPTRLTCGSGPNVLWGVMTVDHTAVDGYVYVYGMSGTSSQALYLARTTRSGLTDFSSWTFFRQMDDLGEAQWSSCGNTTALPVGPTTTGSVEYINGMFWLIAMDPDGRTIIARPSPTPWAFTERRINLYTAPETFDSPYWWLVYEPRIQRGLRSGDNLVLTYNVNSMAVNTGCVSSHAYDAGGYRPRFLTVPQNWFDAYGGAVRGPSATAAARVSDVMASPMRGRSPRFNPEAAPPPGFRAPAASTAVSAAGTIGGISDWFRKWGDPCPNVPAPADFTATARSDGTADLAWEAPGSDIWTYLYQCDSTTTACATTSSCATDTGGFTRQYGGLWLTGTGRRHSPVTSQANNGHRFTWYVCTTGAMNGQPIGTNGNGGASVQRSAVVTHPAPAAPANLRGTRSGATVSLLWDEVIFPNPQVYYTPYLWDITAGQTSADAAPVTPVQTTSATVTVPNATHTYGFFVKATNFAGGSPPSNTISR